MRRRPGLGDGSPLVKGFGSPGVRTSPKGKGGILGLGSS